MSRNLLPWYWGGLLLGIAFFAAVLLVKPIGVSTQFVVADALVWQKITPDLITKDLEAPHGYRSKNAYLNKSGGKIAAEVGDPLNYNFIFVIAMMVGAFISAFLKGDRPQGALQKAMPDVWRKRFGDYKMKRYIWSFIAGFIVLFGARLAGGCTSGHMMSGMMQTALSGYLFALGAFVFAIPIAIILFKGRN